MEKGAMPPNKINNYKLLNQDHNNLKLGQDFIYVREALWDFIYSIYKGGPELTKTQANLNLIF